MVKCASGGFRQPAAVRPNRRDVILWRLYKFRVHLHNPQCLRRLANEGVKKTPLSEFKSIATVAVTTV